MSRSEELTIRQQLKDRHGGHGTHAGHHVEMFRRRFWWSLLLTVPIVATSHMVMEWFGYELDFTGMEWVGPVLGSIVPCGVAGRSWRAVGGRCRIASRG